MAEVAAANEAADSTFELAGVDEEAAAVEMAEAAVLVEFYHHRFFSHSLAGKRLCEFGKFQLQYELEPRHLHFCFVEIFDCFARIERSDDFANAWHHHAFYYI